MLISIRGAVRVSALFFAVFFLWRPGLVWSRTGASAAALEGNAESSPASAPTPEQVDFFEKKIRPVLSQNCYSCHSTGKGNSGHLHLDDRNAILAGGRSGAAIVPGNPTASLLMQRISNNNPDHRMPKDGDPLPASVIADFRAWITDGAYWPGDAAARVTKPVATDSTPVTAARLPNRSTTIPTAATTAAFTFPQFAVSPRGLWRPLIPSHNPSLPASAT